MTEGIQVFNEQGFLQISSEFFSLCLAGVFPIAPASPYSFSVQKSPSGAVPLVCFLASDIPNDSPVGVVAIVDEGTYFGVIVGGLASRALVFYPDFPNNDRLNFGIEAFNEEGELTFSTSKPILKISHVIATPNSQASVTVQDITKSAVWVNACSSGFQTTGVVPGNPNLYSNVFCSNYVKRVGSVISCGQGPVSGAPPMSIINTFSPYPIRSMIIFDVSSIL